jgi:6,7-dimethyl-8-ribityllumazine synthase
MASYFEGKLRADGLRFDVVLSRFNDFYGEKLLEGCLDCLRRHGAAEAAIRVFRVPGSFELPQVASRLVQSGESDAIIALGVLIRGETPHFDHIAASVTRGLAGAGIEGRCPVSFGVLTCDTAEQAAARSGSKAGNKGWEAALAAIEMADLFRGIGGAPPAATAAGRRRK